MGVCKGETRLRKIQDSKLSQKLQKSRDISPHEVGLGNSVAEV
jgi:hypothetical protein